MYSGSILKAELKEFPDRMNVEHDSIFFKKLSSSDMRKAAGIAMLMKKMKSSI